MYKSLNSGFHGKAWVRQGRRLRIGQFEEYQQALGCRGCPLLVCRWSRVMGAGR